MLYLDNSATTPILPEVKEAMLPFLLEEFGNPSSKYYDLATNAKKAVDIARANIAKLLGCDSDEVIFTSGATESNNMIIKGVADYYKNERGNHIVTSKVEHPAVLETCKFLEAKGYKVSYLDVDHYGRVNICDVEKIIKNDPPVLISIMWGNNEIGSMNYIEDIAQLCYEYDIFFHTDATQVVGKYPINLEDHPGIRFLSCSGHKIYGPKGIGVAIIKKDKNGLPTKLTPLLHGGGQESGYRSGTLAVHNIVGIGKAAEVAFENLDQNIKKLMELENKLINILTTKFKDIIKFNNDFKDKIPGILNVQFKGINNEVLVRRVSEIMAISTGSACSSSKPSHVLEAIGLSLKEIRESIRISLSPLINESDLEVFNNL